MFVYPVREGVQLPEAFRKYAAQPGQPLTLPPAEIAAGRDDWVDEWTRIVIR
jgi:thiamine transport system substrate-binding protein